MSDPVTNVQIEDVLSSIRRLVSEEIGQQEPLKPRAKNHDEDEQKLVLSPTQKVRQDAASTGSDLWEATEEMAPTESAPVWWHRAASELVSNEAEEPMQLGSPIAEVVEETVTEVAEPEAPVAEVAADEVAEAETEVASTLGEAAIDIDDDDFEPPEGEENIDIGVQIDAMPWQGDEDTGEYSGSVEDDQPEQVEDDAEADVPFSFRPGERLFERLSSKKMTASPLPEVETVESSDLDEVSLEQTDTDLEALLSDDREDEPEEAAEPEPVSEPASAQENYFDAELEGGDLTNIFDEDMLRDMVKDIIRQELQGVLGERITRNVRKLVRREIQRALSDVNKM